MSLSVELLEDLFPCLDMEDEDYEYVHCYSDMWLPSDFTLDLEDPEEEWDLG